MAFSSGKGADVLINEFDLAKYFNNLDLSRDADVPETTVFGDDDRTYIAGLRGGTISLSGFFDNTTTTGSDEVLNATLGVATARLMSAAPIGMTLGNPVYMLTTHTTSYSVTSPVDGVVGVSADVTATAQIDRGVSLHDVTAISSTANGSSVDNAASSAGGGIGSLHISVIATGSTLDVDVEDSPDDAAWTSLISFAQATVTTTSESKTVAGTVDRYTRAAWVRGASGTYTFALAFARR